MRLAYRAVFRISASRMMSATVMLARGTIRSIGHKGELGSRALFCEPVLEPNRLPIQP